MILSRESAVSGRLVKYIAKEKQAFRLVRPAIDSAINPSVKRVLVALGKWAVYMIQPILTTLNPNLRAG